MISSQNNAKMARVHHLRMKEVFTWRSAASIAWLALLLPLFIAVCVVVIRIDILHPYVWLVGLINDIFSLSSVLNSLLIGTVSVFVAVFNPKFCTVTPDVRCNRLAILWQAINPYRLFHATCHGIAAAIITGSLIRLSDPNSDFLIMDCSEHSGCLNEKHLFIMLHGTLLGFCYSLQYFWNSENYIAFPIIQKAKFLRVKGHIRTCMVNSAFKTLGTMKYFYIVYFLFGSWYYEPLDTIWFLADFTLFWSVLVSGTFILTSWFMALHLFKVYTTEAFIFPVETTFAEDEHKCLTNVLNYTTMALVQYLGYLDLCILSEHSVKRRKQIFSLSEPGGHPHNWDSVCKNSMILIKAMASKLEAYQDVVQLDRLCNDTTQDILRQNNISITSPGSSFSTDPYGALSPRPYMSPIGESQSNAVKRLAFKGYTTESQRPNVNGSMPTHTGYPSDSASQPSGRNHTDKPLTSSTRGRITFTDRTERLFSYFKSPLPVAVRRQLFADAQLHIWALTGLSRLVAASYNEDDFGVVQRALPEILSAMLELHSALDKYCKLPVPTAKLTKQTKSSVHPGEQLKNALRETVKSAIYRIVTTFGGSLRYVKISTDNERQLSQFMQGKV
ncbi:nucleoporin NDC1-like [Glandiceps talaboti]